MPSKNITFDPDAGVPKAANFTIHTGADFNANFNVVHTSNSAFNFTGYSGSAQMAKSVAIGATLGVTTSFTVGFTSAYDGKFKVSLGSTDTRNLKKEDTYIMFGKFRIYCYSIVNGNIMVEAGISSAP